MRYAYGNAVTRPINNAGSTEPTVVSPGRRAAVRASDLPPARCGSSQSVWPSGTRPTPVPEGRHSSTSAPFVPTPTFNRNTTTNSNAQQHTTRCALEQILPDRTLPSIRWTGRRETITSDVRLARAAYPDSHDWHTLLTDSTAWIGKKRPC